MADQDVPQLASPDDDPTHETDEQRRQRRAAVWWLILVVGGIYLLTALVALWLWLSGALSF